MSNAIPIEVIATKILLVRGKRVMSDRNLAKLYKVDTSQLTRQVKRNIDRFPEDFMFQLTKGEFQNLMCQFGIPSWGGMLSGVLHSKRAIQVNIQILRACYLG